MEDGESEFFLKSARLGFREWSEGDIELAWAIWGDDQVSKFVGGPFTREQIRERLVREISNQKTHGIQYWPFFLLGGGAHAGCCGLKPYKPESRVYETGFYVRREFWGKGYALEAARAVIGYAFGHLRAAGIFAGHNPANDASCILLSKLGFKYTHDEFYQPTGLYHKSYMLTKEDYNLSCRE